MKINDILESTNSNLAGAPSGIKIMTPQQFVASAGDMPDEEEGVAEGLEQKYVWHGSRQPIKMLEPRQSVDTGGAAGSNQNAIYATSDPKVAIAVGGLTTPDSDTAMFPNDPQMVLFSGKIRKGENVYLHKLPFYGTDGKPQFVQGAHDREFYSMPGVKGIKPVEIKAVPVDKYLNLIRTATPNDLELRKQNMKEGVAEGKLKEFAVSGDGGNDGDDSLFNYAKMWYNGDLKTQRQVEKALQKSGLDIGENEDENGGAYISDMSGDYYESWTSEDLEQGVAEGREPDKKYTIKKSYTMSTAGVEKSVWYIMDGDFVVDATDLRRDAKYYADKWNAAEKDSKNA